MKAVHKCASGSRWREIKWYKRFRLISQDHPTRIKYFKSDVSVVNEQFRHLKISKFTIHPFSKFRAWYEMYLIYLYGSVLITKPVDAGLTQGRDCKELMVYKYYNMATDALCWIDIIINFFMGYEMEPLNQIEVRIRNTAKHYASSLYFIIDVLSSFPKCGFFGIVELPHIKVSWRVRLLLGGIISILGMFKVLRVISFISCIWRTAEYFRVKSKGLIVLICTLLGSFMLVHWLACLQFAVPRMVRINFAESTKNISWFYSDHIYSGQLYRKQSLSIRYNHCLFKSSAYILSIYFHPYELDHAEEYILAVCTFLIGKVLISFIWIILTLAILNWRVTEIAFKEKMNQLEEYMIDKQLPLPLRNRIIQYFMFRFKNKYFKEELINNMLSDNLRSEVNMHTSKFLIENVPLFENMSRSEIAKVMDHLIPEIFLPNDTVIFAGTFGDAMYFLLSGTVAVYTRSGKEICHLQDGAYFGEISLLLKSQLRVATIVALETSHVYKLLKKDLDKCLMSNSTVKSMLLDSAEARLKQATLLDEEYKASFFDKSVKTAIVN